MFIIIIILLLLFFVFMGVKNDSNTYEKDKTKSLKNNKRVVIPYDEYVRINSSENKKHFHH